MELGVFWFDLKWIVMSNICRKLFYCWSLIVVFKFEFGVILGDYVFVLMVE